MKIAERHKWVPITDFSYVFYDVWLNTTVLDKHLELPFQLASQHLLITFVFNNILITFIQHFFDIGPLVIIFFLNNSFNFVKHLFGIDFWLIKKHLFDRFFGEWI